MNFLPEDYQSPKNANQNYMKLQQGENRIRILTKPIIGWEAWSDDNKPVRFRLDQKYTKDAKHFWAFVVWNVVDQKIQIYQVTQATIRNAIEQLTKDADWGSPYEYDIKINKKGEKMETEYTVNPAPHKPVSQEILKAFKERPIQLEALFEGLDPFATGYKFYTSLMSDLIETKVVSSIPDSLSGVSTHDVKPLDIEEKKITDEQFIELSELKNGCSEASQSGFGDYLKNMFKIESLNDLPQKYYQNVKDKLTIRFKDHQKALVEAEMQDTPENKGKKK